MYFHQKKRTPYLIIYWICATKVFGQYLHYLRYITLYFSSIGLQNYYFLPDVKRKKSAKKVNYDQNCQDWPPPFGNSFFLHQGNWKKRTNFCRIDARNLPQCTEVNRFLKIASKAINVCFLWKLWWVVFSRL